MKKLFNNKKKDVNNEYQESLTDTPIDNKGFFKKGNIKRMSKIAGLIFLGFILGIISSPSGYTIEEYDSLDKSYNESLTENKSLRSENAKLQAKVDEAAPWFEIKEEERKAEEEKLAAQKEAEAKAQEEKEQAEAKAQEEAEAKEKAEAEAKEKQGYETGITYSQLARTPDDYMFQKVKFKGKVIQVMEGTDTIQIRLAVSGNYDNILLCEYSSDIVSSRILEDDYITVYGLSAGLITYESTMGGNITIPSMVIDKIGK